jgi:hypothetical protein
MSNGPNHPTTNLSICQTSYPTSGIIPQTSQFVKPFYLKTYTKCSKMSRNILKRIKRFGKNLKTRRKGLKGLYVLYYGELY